MVQATITIKDTKAPALVNLLAGQKGLTCPCQVSLFLSLLLSRNSQWVAIATARISTHYQLMTTNDDSI